LGFSGLTEAASEPLADQGVEEIERHVTCVIHFPLEVGCD
jgi:hypothetical protein